MDPDPDPRGPKTCGSGGSGFGSGSATLLLNKKDVYQHRIPKNLLLTHLFLLETRSRTRTRFVASNSWLKDWPRKRWIFYAVTNSVRNLDPADQQKPNVMCSQLRDSPHPPPPTPRFPSDLKSVHFFLITDPDADKDPVLDPWFDDQKFSKKKFTNSFGLLDPDPDLDTHFICYIKSNSFFIQHRQTPLPPWRRLRRRERRRS